MTSWWWVIAGYLLSALLWAAYLLWTRPGRGR